MSKQLPLTDPRVPRGFFEKDDGTIVFTLEQPLDINVAGMVSWETMKQANENKLVETMHAVRNQHFPQHTWDFAFQDGFGGPSHDPLHQIYTIWMVVTLTPPESGKSKRNDAMFSDIWQRLLRLRDKLRLWDGYLSARISQARMGMRVCTCQDCGRGYIEQVFRLDRHGNPIITQVYGENGPVPLQATADGDPV